jgi:MFS superfamily sulfate permease-like transporter
VCPKPGKEEALVSLTTTIIMLVCGWLAVAAAMLWGVLRITRRHHHPRIQPATPVKAEKPADRTATAH